MGCLEHVSSTSLHNQGGRCKEQPFVGGLLVLGGHGSFEAGVVHVETGALTNSSNRFKNASFMFLRFSSWNVTNT